MNPDLLARDKWYCRRRVHLFRDSSVGWHGLRAHLRFSHHGIEAARFEVSLRFRADFVDLFEVAILIQLYPRSGAADRDCRSGTTLCVQGWTGARAGRIAQSAVVVGRAARSSAPANPGQNSPYTHRELRDRGPARPPLPTHDTATL
jgi:hypothetical protein